MKIEPALPGLTEGRQHRYNDSSPIIWVGCARKEPNSFEMFDVFIQWLYKIYPDTSETSRLCDPLTFDAIDEVDDASEKE